MGPTSLTLQIKSLQTQLDVLKAQAESMGEAEQAPGSFGDLYGLLTGQSETSTEDIDNVLYRLG